MQTLPPRVGVTGLVTRALPTGSQLGCPMGIRECRRCKEHTGGDASVMPQEPQPSPEPNRLPNRARGTVAWVDG